MIKKVSKITFILLLSLFSFYYTEKSIDLVRNQDPIMKQIKTTDEKYKTPAVDAKITGNTIIPGKSGKEIDYEETYTKMKQYGNYNEALTILKEVKPTISIEDHYDKFIVGGYTERKSVALVFKVETKSPIEIISILNNKQAQATFFLDGMFLENNHELVSKMSPHQLELLSYNSEYDQINFSSSKSYLETLTNRALKYCYSEYDREDIITLCQKLNMHTIIPTIQVEKNPYQTVKDRLQNSAIISLPLTEQTTSELPIIIDYIRQRGYKLETLESILTETSEK